MRLSAFHHEERLAQQAAHFANHLKRSPLVLFASRADALYHALFLSAPDTPGQQHRPKLRLNVQINRSRDGFHIFSRAFEGHLGELGHIENEMIGPIIAAINQTVPRCPTPRTPCRGSPTLSHNRDSKCPRAIECILSGLRLTCTSCRASLTGIGKSELPFATEPEDGLRDRTKIFRSRKAEQYNAEADPYELSSRRPSCKNSLLGLLIPTFRISLYWKRNRLSGSSLD